MLKSNEYFSQYLNDKKAATPPLIQMSSNYFDGN
jgi:hypothetical protein